MIRNIRRKKLVKVPKVTLKEKQKRKLREKKESMSPVTMREISDIGEFRAGVWSPDDEVTDKFLCIAWSDGS